VHCLAAAIGRDGDDHAGATSRVAVTAGMGTAYDGRSVLREGQPEAAHLPSNAWPVELFRPHDRQKPVRADVRRRDPAQAGGPEPNRVADDIRRETVTLERNRLDQTHLQIGPTPQTGDKLAVRLPAPWTPHPSITRPRNPTQAVCHFQTFKDSFLASRIENGIGTTSANSSFLAASVGRRPGAFRAPGEWRRGSFL